MDLLRLFYPLQQRGQADPWGLLTRDVSTVEPPRALPEPSAPPAPVHCLQPTMQRWFSFPPNTWSSPGLNAATFISWHEKGFAKNKQRCQSKEILTILCFGGTNSFLSTCSFELILYFWNEGSPSWVIAPFTRKYVILKLYSPQWTSAQLK